MHWAQRTVTLCYPLSSWICWVLNQVWKLLEKLQDITDSFIAAEREIKQETGNGIKKETGNGIKNETGNDVMKLLDEDDYIYDIIDNFSGKMCVGRIWVDIWINKLLQLPFYGIKIKKTCKWICLKYEGAEVQ